jgi:hypothetical protein
LQALGLQASAPIHFEIRYFDFAPAPGAPEGFAAILRLRLTGGRTELTYKLRGSEPLPAEPSLKRWNCPLGATDNRKDEADVTFIAAGDTVTAYSRSCSIGSRAAELQPPAALQARPRGCTSKMTRLRSGRLKVEQWQLADGSTLLEASRPGRHDAASMQAFEQSVLGPLLALGVQPLQRSKSAIGGECVP